ncbi:dual specificity protein phosphatase family protein [Deinococcus cellulosilyticus]|uniref:Tyrosine specific protein phosphatases domain-containing protein n=1 Tax=Deinococcus cellulosilyticus (strain DSM 18568 / NBRC 106333 / KACC 11606 / 5516J-15) TaxID=1223518 RepID=A0A511N4N2_DEIC1|nr:dual specificity protein phosphatase family protein [Deinococcus cellulosilyticus]GEM47820.1 hypothetical protein DC3_34550 [Deinococcus cellulosilyticus NBRC 106333 = KACC 11606]
MFWKRPSPKISVSGVHDLALRGVSHIISINDPDRAPPREVLQSDAEVLVLKFSDTFESLAGSDPPTLQHLQAVKAFIEEERQQIRRVHVHCKVGTSRSTAVALLVMHLLEPQKSEAELVQMLKKVRRQAAPNPLIIRLMDQQEGTHFAEALSYT